MSVVGTASIWATEIVGPGSHSSKWSLVALAIIPIAILLRVRQGRRSPDSLYTPPPIDPETGQDMTASEFTDPSGAVNDLPLLQPASSSTLPAFTYGLGTPLAGVTGPAAPQPPASVPGLPQFGAPPSPAVAPRAVPEFAGPTTAAPGPAAPALAGLPATGSFSSQALRIERGLPLFIVLAFLVCAGGPAAMISRYGVQTFVSGGWVFVVAAVAVLALGVRSLQQGISFDAEGVVAHTVLLTRRWEWQRLQEFQIEDALINGQARMGANLMRKMLRVVEVDGKFTVLRSFVAPQGGPYDRSWLDDAASALNAQIQARRG
jgi:hypothetical protein